MPYEDFTSYTEVEPDDRIQKTATHVDILSKRNESSYLYKDKGSGHFSGDFEHKIDIKAIDYSANYAFAFLWMLSNAINDAWKQWVTGNKVLSVDFYRSDVALVIKLRYWNGNSVVEDVTPTMSFGTWYYLLISRSDSTLTCKIYSTALLRDAKGTPDIDTLTLTVTTDSFQYVYACASFNDGYTQTMNADIENLDLQEYIPQTYTYTQPMIRISMTPRGWVEKVVSGETVGLRRPYVPFQVPQPLKPVIT